MFLTQKGTSMFNPWKQAKQQREAQKNADTYLKALEDASEWFSEAEQSGEDVAQAVDDETNCIYYYAKSVHQFYDMIAANRTDFTTAMENDIIATLTMIVDADKTVSLTDLMNQAIVVRYDPKDGALITPQHVRLYDLGNGSVRIGNERTVA
jgi:hypothetical protein